ncbi:MAG: sulfite exporter TauE/SafE family protein [Chloroflexota bacterium]|nr:sulfite exporter TauE/SafE family protein [Chloroflexota bacterium]
MTESLTPIIVGLLIIFLAGITQGLTGFGFALVSVPILIMFLSPKAVVPIVIMDSIAINVMILFEARKWLDLRRIWPLIVASIIGLPVGTYLLVVLNVSVLKILIGVITIPFAIALMLGFKKEIRNEKLALSLIGLLAGVLNASTSLSGPPIILFLINQGVEKLVFRANLVAYFMVLAVATTAALAVGGVVTGAVIKYSLWFLPAAILGTLVGMRLAHRVNEKVFRNAALIIVTIAALASVASGFGLY